MGAGADVRWDELKPVLRLINERLDHIEEFLVRSAARNGPAYTLFGPVDTAAPGPDVVELARAGKTIDAIRRYREQTGVGLEQARTVVLGI
jgi:ribosomal protein L7/L12